MKQWLNSESLWEQIYSILENGSYILGHIKIKEIIILRDREDI